MSRKKPDPELIDDENPKITQEELRRARPAAEVLPKYIGQKATDELLARGRGRPSKEDRKVNQTIRIDSEVLDAYRREGKGWQTRINQVLREHMPRHGN
ncbi:MAG: BrnA antitoxin family protein [Bryobacteraceae bacterium]